MEVVGTVVGVVSFGITLCDGFNEYCRAWRHQDEDVRTLNSLDTTLQRVLGAIKTRLESTPALNLSRIGEVMECIKACKDHIEAANRLNELYSPGLGK